MVLNAKPYTYYNAPAYEEIGGWSLDATGRPMPADAREGLETGTLYANIQPYLGTRRSRQAAGTNDVHRIKGYIAKRSGAFPPIYNDENTDRRLPTVIEYAGHMYKVEVVDNWSRGLLPHLYFEAERFVMDLGQNDPEGWEP